MLLSLLLLSLQLQLVLLVQAMPKPRKKPPLTPPGSVCGTKGGMKFTYFNACYASKDGAKVSSQGDCKPAKAMKTKKKMKMKM
jgi:hypothetical protein